jgi:hypothetical protein
MLLQNLFASITTRRRRSVQPFEKKGTKLPKHWQELLDVAGQKQVETYTDPEVKSTEDRRLHDKTGA